VSHSPIQHVSDTAFLVAHYRALESSRSDALFRDPLASRLAGEKGRSHAEKFTIGDMIGWSVVIRTMIIDDFIRRAIARGVDTVLSLGAGLDTRPYRLELPRELRWVEADYPDVIAYKERLLDSERPHCSLARVGLDLEDTESRRGLLARTDRESRRIIVLTEGLVPYLTVAQAGVLANELRGMTRLDSWIIDYFSPEAHRYRERMGAMKQMQHAPFRFQPSDWFGFFAEHGWLPREIRYLQEEGVCLRRPAPLPWKIRLFTKLFGILASAEQRARFARFTGYILLEPAEVSGPRT
jgi:methyltransferase (TIGR00027 family)